MARKSSKMKEKIELTQIASEIKKTTVKQFLNDNGLPYAYYTISSRALIGPDGSKPVNRRILVSMYKDFNLKPTAKHHKAGSITGHVMGNYHPHGNLSIEDAISRLAQPFNMRVPLIDPQGSVGFVTGDKAAAVRYWEARLTPAAYELVRELDQDTVDYIPNEMETGVEPVLLPIKWPVGIVNGTQGIAVGYASNMPSHNPGEVMDAVIARVQGKLNNSKQIIKYIKGPDFPTGGELIGLDGVQEYFDTGKGSFVIRGKYEIEALSRGRHVITFYELPYQVSAENVLEAIRKAQSKNKLKDISEAKDLSGMKIGLKVSIYVKAGANPLSVLEELWKETPCQSKFATNNTVLIDGVPKQVGLIDLLDQFIDFRTECFTRKTQFNIDKLEKDMHQLEGILKILVNIDKAIKIIRNSKTDIEAKEELIKTFKVDDGQAEYILQMRLRKLTQQDRESIELKAKELSTQLDELSKILNDEDVFKKTLIEELRATKKIIDDERKTTITNISNEDLAEQAKLAAQQEKLLSKDVECKVSTLVTGQIVKSIGHYEPAELVVSEVNTTTQGNLFALDKSGYIKEFPVNAIPINTPIDPVSIGVENKLFKSIVTQKSIGTLIVTNLGNVNITKSNKLKEGVFVTLIPMEEVVYATPVYETDLEEKFVALMSKDGTFTKFPLNSVRQSGQGSGTIAGMKDAIIGGATLIKEESGLISITNNTIKTTYFEDLPAKGRATKGYKLHTVEAKDSIIRIYSDENAYTIVNKNYKPIDLPEYSKRPDKGTKIDTKNLFLY